ncbi:hypothetical protein [Tsukamurella ocularis]|uniref:hypothetical protein n=1 Tax=Tsukamurella ocularis TaxID=1970234 RepID=UPI0039EEA0E0
MEEEMMGNRTAGRVRRSRLGRGIVALAVAGVCVVGAAGCTSAVSGEATPSDGGLFGVGLGSSGTAGSGAVITAAGLDGETCKANSLAFDIACATPTLAGKSLPAGSTLMIKAGDVARFPQDSGDRVCAVGAFARDSSGAVWGIGGADCATFTSKGDVRTADGYVIGTMRTVELKGTTAATVPAFKLASGVQWSQTAKTIRPATMGTAVTAAAPHGSLTWSGAAGPALVWRGGGSAPAPQIGDAGAPVTQGDALVGLLAQKSVITTADQLTQVLAALGSGTTLAV